MSAFVCDGDHIKQLAIFAATKGRYDEYMVNPRSLVQKGGEEMTRRSRSEVATYYANVLYSENIRSVRARYPEDDFNGLPGPCQKPMRLVVTTKEIAEGVRVSPVALLKMCNCLDYQSCETDDWEQTLAYTLLQYIKDAAINALPGYEEAPWEYSAA